MVFAARFSVLVVKLGQEHLKRHTMANLNCFNDFGELWQDRKRSWAQNYQITGNRSAPLRVQKTLPALCKDKDNLQYNASCSNTLTSRAGDESVPGLGSEGVVGRRKVKYNGHPFYMILELHRKLEVKVASTASRKGNYWAKGQWASKGKPLMWVDSMQIW